MKSDWNDTTIHSAREKSKRTSNWMILVFGIVLLVSVVGFIREELTDYSASLVYDMGLKNMGQVKAAELSSDDVLDFTTIHANGCPAGGWISIPDTKIDYPLVQGKDNAFYLDHDAYGNESKAGAVFINFANAPDLTDDKTVIFGHNMLNGSMFSELKKYKDEAYGKEHDTCYIYMEDDSKKTYKLRYFFLTTPSYEPIYVCSKAEKAKEVADVLKEDATIVFDEYTGGRLICLSTCTNRVQRSVVVFEEIEE